MKVRPLFVALAVLAIRLVFCATGLRTYFNPDEFWQGPEVAHRLVYGYGYLTWEWRAGIRSYAHPALLALAYRAAELVPSRPDWLVLEAPRILHAALAAVADAYVYLLARRLFGPRAARWTLVCQLSLWFNAFALQRTFSNSLEALLTAAGLARWPWPGLPRVSRRDRAAAAALAAASFVVRPTAVLLWIPLALAHLTRASDPLRFLADGLLASAAVLSASAALDRRAYGRWTLPFVEFFRFNVLRGGSAAYGTHPWHWYLTQGAPAVLGVYLPLVLAGVWAADRSRRWPAHAAAIATASLSCFGHKEFRFLLPLLPLALPYAGLALERLVTWARPPPAKEAPRRPARLAAFAVLLVALLAANRGAAAYLGTRHQRGAVDAVEWLRARDPPPASVHFLMPCHSSPFYSSLHRPIPMRILTCEPHWRDGPPEPSEQDAFYEDPLAFVRGYYEGGRAAEGRAALFAAWRCLDPAIYGPALPAARPCPAAAPSPLPPLAVPSHLVLFDDPALLSALRPFRTRYGFRECARFFHAHVLLESRLAHEVVVLCRQT